MVEEASDAFHHSVADLPRLGFIDLRGDPGAMANAVAATDAVTFRSAPRSLLDDWETGPDWTRALIRALLYRLGPTGLLAAHQRLMGGLVTHVERVRPVVSAVLSRG